MSPSTREISRRDARSGGQRYHYLRSKNNVAWELFVEW